MKDSDKGNKKIGVYVEIGPNLKDAIKSAMDMAGEFRVADVIEAFDIKGIVETALENK